MGKATAEELCEKSSLLIKLYQPLYAVFVFVDRQGFAKMFVLKQCRLP